MLQKNRDLNIRQQIDNEFIVVA